MAVNNPFYWNRENQMRSACSFLLPLPCINVLLSPTDFIFHIVQSIHLLMFLIFMFILCPQGNIKYVNNKHLPLCFFVKAPDLNCFVGFSSLNERCDCDTMATISPGVISTPCHQVSLYTTESPTMLSTKQILLQSWQCGYRDTFF